MVLLQFKCECVDEVGMKDSLDFVKYLLGHSRGLPEQVWAPHVAQTNDYHKNRRLSANTMIATLGPCLVVCFGVACRKIVDSCALRKGCAGGSGFNLLGMHLLLSILMRVIARVRAVTCRTLG